MIKQTSAYSCKEMIVDCQLVENNFGYNNVSKLFNNVNDFWPVIENIPNIDTTDKWTKYSLKLRTIAAKTSSISQKIFGFPLIICPLPTLNFNRKSNFSKK